LRYSIKARKTLRSFLNNPPVIISMDDIEFSLQDLELFAEHLGLSGTDYDLYYESYYDLDEVEYDDFESHWDGMFESIETTNESTP